MTLDPQHHNAAGHLRFRPSSKISSSLAWVIRATFRSRKRETDMRSFVPVRSFPPEISNVPLSSSSASPVDFCLRCTAASSTTEAVRASEISAQVDLVRGLERAGTFICPGVLAKFLGKARLASNIHPALLVTQPLFNLVAVTQPRPFWAQGTRSPAACLR